MTDTQTPDETSVGLGHYLDVVRRRKWLVLFVLALALASAAVVTVTQQSKYKAQTTIVVGQAGGLVQPQNAGAIQPFSATMKELITSTVVARRVVAGVPLDITPEQVLKKMSVSFNPESAALKVSVVDHSPLRAKAIARQIGIVFSALVGARFGRGTPATSTAPATPPLTATVWDPAHVIPGKVEPKPLQNLVIAGALGLVLGLLCAFLRDYFDRTLRTSEEIQQAFGAPVIGQIPTVRGKDERPRMLWDEEGAFAEAFHSLRANLQYLAVDKPLRRIVVTSASAEQGKTTVCANLAIALAQAGGSVVVIDTDLRRPQLGGVFEVSEWAPGLTSVLVGIASLGAAVREIALPSRDSRGASGRKVAFLPSGPLPPNPSELMASDHMGEVVESLSTEYETIILDSPPILLVADSVELAKLADGVIVVARSKKATRDEARDLRALADRLGIHVVGLVVTDAAVRSGYGYDAYLEPEGRGSAEAARQMAQPPTVPTIVPVSPNAVVSAERQTSAPEA